MQRLEFNVGDTCWIAVGEEDLQQGTVVHVFNHYGPQYVIEIETPIDPLLEVRDGFIMSDDPNKPLGYMRRS